MPLTYVSQSCTYSCSDKTCKRYFPSRSGNKLNFNEDKNYSLMGSFTNSASSYFTFTYMRQKDKKTSKMYLAVTSILA